MYLVDVRVIMIHRIERTPLDHVYHLSEVVDWRGSVQGCVVFRGWSFICIVPRA